MNWWLWIEVSFVQQSSELTGKPSKPLSSCLFSYSSLTTFRDIITKVPYLRAPFYGEHFLIIVSFLSFPEVFFSINNEVILVFSHVIRVQHWPILLPQQFPDYLWRDQQTLGRSFSQSPFSNSEPKIRKIVVSYEFHAKKTNVSTATETKVSQIFAVLHGWDIYVDFTVWEDFWAGYHRIYFLWTCNIVVARFAGRVVSCRSVSLRYLSEKFM